MSRREDYHPALRKTSSSNVFHIQRKSLCSAAVGEVTEWFKVPVLKTGVRESVPWVRIPPSPPNIVLNPMVEGIHLWGILLVASGFRSRPGKRMPF
jgi:hypothetical protein